MTTIWKDQLPITHGTSETYTVGRILHAEYQDGAPTLWYEKAEAGSPRREVEIYCVFTGADFKLPEGADHCASVVEPDGLVWHYYAVVRGWPPGDA